jgi:hypothetical protein
MMDEVADETTSLQVFVRCRGERRVSLPIVLSPLVQRGHRRSQAKGGVFAFAPTPLLATALLALSSISLTVTHGTHRAQRTGSPVS